MNPVMQLPGITKKSIDLLSKEVHSEGDSLWELRCLSRDEAADVFKKMPKGMLGSPIRATLDSLFAIPKVTLTQARVTHNVDKVSGRSRGTLNVTVALDRASKHSTNDHATLSIVLGSLKQRLLLGYSEVSISRNGKWTIDKEIDFDWESANADGGEGGGYVVLRLLLDSVRGVDSELLLRLQ